MAEDPPKHAAKFNKVFQFWKKFDITLQAQVGNAESGAPPTKRIFGRGRGITTNSDGTMILSSSPPTVISPRGIQSPSPVSYENTSDSHEGKPEDAQTTILREPLRSLMRLASTRKAKEMYEQDLATKPTSEISTPETNGKLESESSAPPLESTYESPSTSTTIPSLDVTSNDARSGEESKETQSEIVKEEEVATAKVEVEMKDEIVEVIEERKVETEGLKEEVSEGQAKIEEIQEVVTEGNETEAQSSVQEEWVTVETAGSETHVEVKEESDLKSAATPTKTKGSKKHKKKRKTKSTITNNPVV
jgi:hypothetical protein